MPCGLQTTPAQCSPNLLSTKTNIKQHLPVETTSHTPRDFPLFAHGRSSKHSHRVPAAAAAQAPLQVQCTGKRQQRRSWRSAAHRLPARTWLTCPSKPNPQLPRPCRTRTMQGPASKGPHQLRHVARTTEPCSDRLHTRPRGCTNALANTAALAHMTNLTVFGPTASQKMRLCERRHTCFHGKKRARAHCSKALPAVTSHHHSLCNVKQLASQAAQPRHHTVLQATEAAA